MTVWTVIQSEDDPRRGRLIGPMYDAPCALGRTGMIPADAKREGDGASPMGTYPFRQVYYRPDKVPRPMSGVPVGMLKPDYGWCDDASSAHYNRLVRLPFGPSHEKMWRDDDVYDVVVVIGHNDSPVIKGLGSAIFMHVAREGYTPTEGCVALTLKDLTRFLRQVGPDDSLKIG
ncbi:L,D-transpeptidase family protein [Kordiimonas gwangyangensis]|uniref:L,D-transpeptidase family protein n=1 Tax=Kordiimonas gwangyangensis TaxID=288022 RepID=UPI0003A1E7A2|nr:L,D-transpeptidase family protein [Kordiimonas gwangyangensis]